MSPRLTHVALAPLLALAMVPAAAALAAPPQNRNCSEAVVTWPSGVVERDAPFEVRVSVTDGSTPTVRLLRQQPGPVVVVAAQQPESGSAPGTPIVFTTTLAQTSTLGVVAARNGDCPDDDPSVQSRQIAVRQDPPPTQAYSCPYVRIPDGSDYSPGADVTARPGQVVDLPWGQGSATGTVTLTRTVPEPVQQVRSATGTTGTWQVRVAENHQLVMQSADERCAPATYRISVAPNVSLSARRNAPRHYTFTGRVYPARGQLVTLYLADEEGRTIAAQQRVGPDGSYRIDRRFLGSGRFQVTAGASPVTTLVAGQSNPRPTVIH